MKNRLITSLFAIFVGVIFTAACASTTSSPTPVSTTTLDGATLLQQRCSVCHPLSFVEKSKHTAADWKLIVEVMVSRGAQLTPEEEPSVVNFLSANFGK